MPLLEAAAHLQTLRRRAGAGERVDFSLRAGEVVALAGDNGAGKSTLIKIISGVFPPDGGELHYPGSRVTFANPHDARDRGIETIYQDLALADNLDVGANMFLGREPMTRLLRPADDRPQADARRGGGDAGHAGHQAGPAGPPGARRCPAGSGMRGDRPRAALERAGADHGRTDGGAGRAGAAQGGGADPVAEGARRRHRVHLAQPRTTSSRSATASWCCGAASTPASAWPAPPGRTRSCA